MEDELSAQEEHGKEETQEQKELIYRRVEELKLSTAALLAENDMFERFIGRLDPLDLMPQARGEGPGTVGGSQLEGGGAGRRHRSRFKLSDCPQLLTLDQKLHVAQREVTETRRDRRSLRKTYERTQDNNKATLKEAELRLTEIKKTRSKFERRLPKPTEDNRLEIIDPVKVLQFIQDKFKVSQLEKFRLKNQDLRAQEMKLLQQLNQKKGMGKAEYEEIFLDFTEPQIEQNVEELQINSLKVHRLLSSHKNKLQNITAECAELSRDIARRKQTLARIEKEIQRAEEERLKAETLNQHLRQQLADYRAPDVMEYLQIKTKHKKLQDSVLSWQRKVEMAELALRTDSKLWSKQKVILTPANSAEVGGRTQECCIPVKLPHIMEEDT